jgi:hypothetical protein
VGFVGYMLPQGHPHKQRSQVFEEERNKANAKITKKERRNETN